MLVLGSINQYQNKNGIDRYSIQVKELEVYRESQLEPLAGGKWQNLITNKQDFVDMRQNKPSPNYPDFKHKDQERDIAMWLNSCPPELREQVDALSNVGEDA